MMPPAPAVDLQLCCHGTSVSFSFHEFFYHKLMKMGVSNADCACAVCVAYELHVISHTNGVIEVVR